MSLIILTKPPAGFAGFEQIKLAVRHLFFGQRGPGAVVDSVLRGLFKIGTDFKFNPRLSEIKPDDTVWVNSSLSALAWAISAKRQAKFRRLAAGPNLVVSPVEHNRIIASPEIDCVLEPSEWVRDFYLSQAPELSGRVCVWPAGVALPPASSGERRLILVYYKTCSDAGLLARIESVLKSKDLEYEVLRYGSYKPAKYYSLLEKSKAMVYLSNSESQGIALAEAWVREVPTLVWDRGYFEHGSYSWKAKNISAPYLVPQAGVSFAKADEFEDKLGEMLAGLESFSPRRYVEDNLSDEATARKLLSILMVKN